MIASQTREVWDPVVGPSHLSKHYPARTSPRYREQLTDREWWCKACGRKVTRSPKGLREYGHGRYCEFAGTFVPEEEVVDGDE